MLVPVSLSKFEKLFVADNLRSGGCGEFSAPYDRFPANEDAAFYNKKKKVEGQITKHYDIESRPASFWLSVTIQFRVYLARRTTDASIFETMSVTVEGREGGATVRSSHLLNTRKPKA